MGSVHYGQGVGAFARLLSDQSFSGLLPETFLILKQSSTLGEPV